MKHTTTRNKIEKQYSRIYCAGYCEIQNLLKGFEPVAYNSGVCGWNYDLYDINGVAVITGYRFNFGTKLNNVKKYEAEARNVMNSDGSYDERIAATHSLINELINSRETNV